ncbi:hypothetical protein [Arthrobacter sp. U41]|uniref:hypothetical protein n=1 Tax=Arthrobacter sp. U41 TaxID=1849032 RepID=UPI0011AAAD40|nr:hypothetical protein [Arthrobacter sp. U41]
MNLSDWIDTSNAPSLIDWISLLGVVVSALAALSARRKAKAVQDSIAATKKKIATAHLGNGLDALKRLHISLDQAIQDDDAKGARYVLLWITQESARCSALIRAVDVANVSSSDSAETLTELLGRISTGASEAKSKTITSPKTKVATITRSLKADLDALAFDLEGVITQIGYGMEGDLVHAD